jgi:predicted Zn finger-like uncharacterized protein
MIITCNNCHKKFDIDSSLIPEKGRLLQCNGCNYKWFFKKDIMDEPHTQVKINNPAEELEAEKNEVSAEETEHEEVESSETIELLDKNIKNDFVLEKITIKDKSNKREKDNHKKEVVKNKKSYNILGLIIVFIISFIALIIVVDTFQNPISKIVPNVEFLLYNLYETIKDVVLFFTDLI